MKPWERQWSAIALAVLLCSGSCVSSIDYYAPDWAEKEARVQAAPQDAAYIFVLFPEEMEDPGRVRRNAPTDTPEVELASWAERRVFVDIGEAEDIVLNPGNFYRAAVPEGRVSIRAFAFTGKKDRFGSFRVSKKRRVGDSSSLDTLPGEARFLLLRHRAKPDPSLELEEIDQAAGRALLDGCRWSWTRVLDGEETRVAPEDLEEGH